jgi:quercetin dioxygenase-like cupin family protein
MKFVSLKDAEVKPVSHDPNLMKKVLLGPGELPHIGAVSHIVLNPGDRASAHSHADAHEVFWGIKGAITFRIEGKDVRLLPDACLVVEPGEEHSVEGAEEGSEMLYFLLKS